MANKVLVYKDTHAANRFQEDYNAAKAHLESVISAYNALGLSPLVNSELTLLFNQTDELILEKITGGELTIQGVKLKAKSMMDMIVLPDGYEDFKGQIAAFSNWLRTGLRQSIEHVSTQFMIDDEGEVQFTPTVLNQIENAGSYFTRTEKGKAVFDFIKELESSFFELKVSAFIRDKTDLANLIEEGIMKIDYENQSFILNHQYISNI